MALTNDEELAWKMSILRTHGITREPSRLEREASGPWYYEQQTLGFNYRMTDLQAALGLSQLDRLEEYVARRNQLANRYDELLKDLPLQRPTIQADNRSSFHLYVVRLLTRENPNKHRQVFEELRRAGIGVNLHYMPVHLQPDYRRLGFSEGLFPESEAYGREAISLPLFPKLTESQQDYVMSNLQKMIND